MGGVCSCGGHEDPVKRLSLIHLTPSDVHTIQWSWRHVLAKESMKDLGIAVFERLFEVHPYLEKYFESLGPDAEAILTNPRFPVHALMVMGRLDLMVQYLHKPILVEALVRKLAGTHIPRAVTSEHVGVMCDVFTDMLHERVDWSGSEEVAAAWEQFFFFVVDVYRAEEEDVAEPIT